MGLLNAGSSGLVSSLVGYDFMGLYTTASTAVALGFQPVFPETAAQSGQVPGKASRPPRWSVAAGVAGGLSFRRRQLWIRFRALGVFSCPLVLESVPGAC